MRIISVGEVLWDVFADYEHVGGAALNFAYHAARLGHQVAMVSGVGKDTRGATVRKFLQESGVETQFLQERSEAATGVVTVRLDGLGQPVYQLQRPAAYDFLSPEHQECAAMTSWGADWVYFGTLFHKWERTRLATRQILECCGGAGRFYDVNLRRDEYTPELVRDLAPQATIFKLNDEEVPEVAEILGLAAPDLEGFARAAAARYGFRAVSITRGCRGCAILWDGEFVECAPYAVAVSDTVGAGDAFAAAFLHGWGLGWGPQRTGDFANRVGALVASRCGGTPAWSVAEV